MPVREKGTWVLRIPHGRVQAAGKILEAGPWVKMIIATANDSVRQDAIAAGLLFIQKPFSISALVKMIEEVLGIDGELTLRGCD